MVAMATNSKYSRYDYVCYVITYLCPKYNRMGCLTFKLEMFQYLAIQRRCCVTMASNM